MEEKDENFCLGVMTYIFKPVELANSGVDSNAEAIICAPILGNNNVSSTHYHSDSLPQK